MRKRGVVEWPRISLPRDWSRMLERWKYDFERKEPERGGDSLSDGIKMDRE
jgi:hypothetical protein